MESNLYTAHILNLLVLVLLVLAVYQKEECLKACMPNNAQLIDSSGTVPLHTFTRVVNLQPAQSGKFIMSCKT